MKLKPPQGCAAVSIGGANYAPGSDGLIDVPEEHAEMLLQSHGFTRPPTSTTAPTRALEPAPKTAPKRAHPMPNAKARARKE